MNDLHLKILNAIQLRILYTPHAIKQMNAEERLITTKEVKEAILHGEIIEDYPDDHRGASCLVLGFSGQRPIHAVSTTKVEPEELLLITVYDPSKRPNKWTENYRERR